MKGLIEAWKHDTDRLWDEITKRDTRWKAEAEKVGRQYRELVEEIKKTEEGKEKLRVLQEEDEQKGKEVETHWFAEIQKMREQLEENEKKTEASVKTAKTLEEELTRQLLQYPSSETYIIKGIEPPEQVHNTSHALSLLPGFAAIVTPCPSPAIHLPRGL
jgi:anion-transporting  ArsA/GET3 family ATPase